MAITFHFYLKKRLNKKNEYPIYLRATLERQHTSITTGLSVEEKHWNDNLEQIRKGHPNNKALNQRLEKFMNRAYEALNRIGTNEKISLRVFKSYFNNTEDLDFFGYAQKCQERLKLEGKYSQLKNFGSTLEKFQNFLGGRKLSMNSIDNKLLYEFESFLKVKYGNGHNTIHRNFKALKTIVNKAFIADLIEVNPFNKFDGASKGKTKKKVSLTLDQIRRLENLVIDEKTSNWYAQQAFLFSFYSGGMRFGDLCRLRWDNIVDDKLVYKMGKNDKVSSSELTNNQWNILFKMDDTTKYIFPFLNDNQDYSNPLILKRVIESRNAQVNGKKTPGKETGLKKIAILAGIYENISMHVARHSLAQIAVDKGIGVYDLSSVLKHSSLTTTQQYLKSLNEDSVNRTMKKLFE